MKTVKALALVTLFPLAASAADYELPAGSWTTVVPNRETTVYCKKEEKTLPECKMVSGVFGNVYVDVNGERLVRNGDLDNALKQINKLRKASVCR